MRPVAKIDIVTDTFQTVVDVLNVIANSMSSEILTANTSLGVTGNTSFPRNAQLIGKFTTNTSVVTDSLRGGDNGASANLLITSNVAVTNTSGTSYFNNVIEANNTTFSHVLSSANDGSRWGLKLEANTISFYSENASTTAVDANTVSYKARTYRKKIIIGESGDITINSANVNGDLSFKDNYKTVVTVNNDIGATVGANVIVYTFPKTDYSAGKILARIKHGANVEMSEILFAQNQSNVYITSYGDILAPNTSPSLAIFDGGINGANVEFYVIQTNTNSSVTLIANLIK